MVFLPLCSWSPPFSSEHPCDPTSCIFPPLVQIGPPGPPCHMRGEGEGPPPHKSLATSQPPIIGNPLTSKFRFYHPYTLTPQNDRLDVAIMPCTLVFVIYVRFK